MALFRDRRVFPRWSFIDSRTLPRPRHAKDETSAASVPSPPEPVAEVVSGPEVEVWSEPPERARPESAPLSWIEERRNWFAEDHWPTEPSEQSVQLASTRPDRPYAAPRHAGLPADTPAEVRARHGRGFASLTRRHRRGRHSQEPAPHRTDIDLVALEAALDEAAGAIGDGLVHIVVWHTTTGLPLASRGDAAPELASAWHGATREVHAALPHADLPDAGSYHLVGLADRRLAVLLHVQPDLGACVTVDLQVVSVDALLTATLPRLGDALAATSTEY